MLKKEEWRDWGPFYSVQMVAYAEILFAMLEPLKALGMPERRLHGIWSECLAFYEENEHAMGDEMENVILPRLRRILEG